MANSKILSRRVDMLGLSKRARTCLERLQVRRAGDFARLSLENLVTLPNCGKRTVAEIVRVARRMGVPLRSGIPHTKDEGGGRHRRRTTLEGSPDGSRPLPLGGLSRRARGRLRDLSIHTINDLSRLSLGQLMGLRNCGPKTAEEITSLGERLGAPVAGGSSPLSSEKTSPRRKISSLDLSKRAQSSLRSLKVQHVGDLARVTRKQLLRLKNCGEKTFREIACMATKLGVKLGAAACGALPRTKGAAGAKALTSGKLDLDLFHRLGDFHFSPRARHGMENLGATYVGDLIQFTDDRLLAERNFGVTTLREIESFLENMGFTLGMDVPGWSQKEAAKIIEKNRERLKALRQRFVAKNYRVSGGPRRTVEEELRFVLSRLAKRRDVAVVYSWIGMTAGKLPTLDRVGQEFYLTRERVRQILEKVGKKLVLTGIPTPRLEAAVELIADSCPSDSSTLAAKLARRGLCRPSVQPAGVVRAAEFFRLGVRCKIEPIDKRPFFIRQEHKKTLRRILAAARRSVERWGCAAIPNVAGQVTEQGGAPANADFVRKALSTKPDFDWLDQASGWFWLTDVPRSRVLNYIEKTLSALPGIGAAELRSKILRHFRLEELPFPGRVLQAIRDRLENS